MAQTVKLAKGAAEAVTKASPNLVKEIVMGASLGIVVGSFWKMYHINSRRKVEDFYAALEKGEITVEAS
ncbi:unnamed protein product [Calypogeia fissa]